jgi:hypothetical protein
MRIIVLGLVLFVPWAAASAQERVYRGRWVATNRDLDGTMTCVVTPLGPNKWRGHFHGVWSGQKFSYRVVFRGPPDNLRGQAVINAARYKWTGEMSNGPSGLFKGRFRSSRYKGYFTLKQRGG